MIIFLLLVIIAILLVGASAFIGALGAIFGMVAFVGAMIALAVWWSIDFWVLFIGFLVSLLIGRGVYLILKPTLEAREKRLIDAKVKQMMAEHHSIDRRELDRRIAEQNRARAGRHLS